MLRPPGVAYPYPYPCHIHGIDIFAAIRDPATKEPLETFTLITTDANELLEPIHDRMPVILEPKDYDRWLQLDDPTHPPIDLLRAFPAEQMIVWKVDSRVGNVRNDDEGCIASLA